MNNPLFNMKSVIKCSYKAYVGAGSGAGAGSRSLSRNFLKVGAGAETKSFGSLTLLN